MYGIVNKLGSLTKDRLIISFAPKNIFYDILKKVGELFPGKSKTTRAYLHPEEDVVKALKQAGFSVRRKEMTSTNFYFSRLLEAVREWRKCTVEFPNFWGYIKIWFIYADKF